MPNWKGVTVGEEGAGGEDAPGAVLEGEDRRPAPDGRRGHEDTADPLPRR
jgi:hypothetical protein